MARRGIVGRIKRLNLAPPLPPANTILPVISGATGGTGASGNTLSISNGTWLNTPTSFTYQWKKATPVTNGGVLVTFNGLPVWTGTPTNLGTASTQALGAGEVGFIIWCTVAGITAAGSGTADSLEIGMVI